MKAISINKTHYLEGDKIELIDCLKNNKEFGPGVLDTIVIHFTDWKNARGAAKYLAKEGVAASAHIVIGRDRNIYQLVPFNKISWHAGKSEYKQRINLNNCSIGIEIDNAGRLDNKGNAWFNQKYPEDQIFKDENGDNWHKYKLSQINLVKSICQLLIDKYNIKYILGHEEIAPGRKIDPGPAFPIHECKQLLKKKK